METAKATNHMVLDRLQLLGSAKATNHMVLDRLQMTAMTSSHIFLPFIWKVAGGAPRKLPTATNCGKRLYSAWQFIVVWFLLEGRGRENEREGAKEPRGRPFRFCLVRER